MHLSSLVSSVLLICGTAPTASAAEKIMIDGSTGVAPLVVSLAKEYQARNPGVVIDIGKGMGTKARIQALQEGRIDIAMASHGLNPAELEKQGMVVREIAKVAVVFGVHAGVPIASLSDDQICAIYSGKALNWQQVGGPDLAIAAFTRPDSEVDAEVVRASIPCLSKLAMPDTVKIAPKGPDMARALATTPGSVGMTTMTVIEQSSGAVKPVAWRGVAPTPANVEGRSYTLTRDSFLVVKADAPAAAARFIDFVRSPSGAKVIAANGAIAVR